MRRISGHAAGAGDVRLCDIEGSALKQILEVESRELALARRDGNDRRTAYFRLTSVIIRRHWFLEPGDIVVAQAPWPAR